MGEVADCSHAWHIGIDDPLVLPPDFINHPFYRPIPPTVEIMLQPVWSQLGISYRTASTADIFGDPSQLEVLTGYWEVNESPQRVYLLVIHEFLHAMNAAFMNEILLISLKKHYGSAVKAMPRQYHCKVSAMILGLPFVGQALAEGTWPLLSIEGLRNNVPTPSSTSTLVPW
jgi:hypothetical protein